ncbi:hypothetical protein JCGZ_17140 [Jatropha curcas]|uniref:Uncharacterized protein n=1 Tax=Jatropha curcas TaxID=180498 RepID=A0A067K2U6_JATCU|nr:hypothetical protein JCGZ_17140 [Jatropha curcas]
MTDSFGLAKFLKATGEIAKGAKAPSLFPVWQREILCARNPPKITCIHQEYEDSNNKKTLNLDQPNMVHRSFFFGPKEIESIKNHLPRHLRNSSTYEVLTSCLWKCRTIAFQLDPNEIVSLSCITSVRANRCMQLPDGFYGNSFIFPAVLSNVGLLCKNPLGYALELVKNCKNQLSEEYVKSVIDLLVISGKPRYAQGLNFLSVDVRNSGLAKVDFGWGNPVYAGPTGAFPYISIFARFKNSKAEDGIVFPIWLPEPVMQRFQDELMKLTGQQPIDFTMKPTIASTL